MLHRKIGEHDQIEVFGRHLKDGVAVLTERYFSSQMLHCSLNIQLNDAKISIVMTQDKVECPGQLRSISYSTPDCI